MDVARRAHARGATQLVVKSLRTHSHARTQGSSHSSSDDDDDDSSSSSSDGSAYLRKQHGRLHEARDYVRNDRNADKLLTPKGFVRNDKFAHNHANRDNGAHAGEAPFGARTKYVAKDSHGEDIVADEFLNLKHQ